MLLIGGIMLAGGLYGAYDAWSESSEMKALLATGKKADGFVLGKRVEQIKSTGRRGSTNITNVHYINCVFVVDNNTPAALPVIVASIAEEAGIAVPPSLAKLAEAAQFDPKSLNLDMEADGAEIRASEEYFNSVSPGSQVQLAVRWDAKDQLKEAVFIRDTGRQNEASNKMLGLVGLSVLGLIFAGIGVSPKDS
jgi:hypothetical protein